MNRRNIIQFKPEGVANIFSPNIRINGEFISPQNVPSASNDYQMDVGNVSYPRMPTVQYRKRKEYPNRMLKIIILMNFIWDYLIIYLARIIPLHQIEMKIYMVSMVMDHLLLMIMPHLYLLH